MSALTWLRRTFSWPPAPLIGPVFTFDLLRTSRRGRFYVTRIGYALFLLLMLSWVYYAYVASHEYRGTMRPDQAADFADAFFSMFMAIQFLVVVGVTPAYMAGAIAEEKERKTLQFLLATDLRDREIVLSKLAARGLNLMMLIITGLPILAGLQFLGGVDPQLVLAGFAATLLTIASLSGLSLFNSVLCRRARDATILTYLMAVAYLGLSGLSWFLLSPAGWATFPSGSPVTVQDVVEGFNAGNIISVLVQMRAQVKQGSAVVNGVVPGYLAHYALFHGIIAALGALGAILRLRPIALREAGESVRSGRRVVRAVSDDKPMVWKEVFAERGPRWHWFGKLIVLLLVLASFVPVVIIGNEFVEGTLDSPTNFFGPRVGRWEALAESVQIWVVGVSGTGVACLLLMGVAVRAAGSVSLERERQTLDSLLTTPLESKAIVFGKWLGAVLSVRWGWLWLGTLWGIGLLTGALHPISLLLLLVSWFVYAGYLAGLGLWFSCSGRSTSRATTNTLLSAIGGAFGHWMIWLCCLPIMLRGGGGGSGDALVYLAEYQAGLSPPINLGVMSSFRLHAFDGGEGSSIAKAAGFGLLGTFTWLLIALGFWEGVNRRFGRMTGRELPSLVNGKEHS